MAETVSVDYLVVGAGVMGMAFADTLVSDSKATIALVDRYARPGGHWTIAYPYVRLHQPSVGYGVNSRRLGEDKIDEHGWNKGNLELASGAEVCSYYQKVLDQTFLTSGRVQYYPKHEYTGEGKFRSLITDKVYRVGDGTRIVDATYSKVSVPAMRPPPYKVSEDVNIITPNELPSITRVYGGYTIIGGGKTGFDACLWLIANGIDPKRLKLILPRDHFLLDRAAFQPGSESAGNNTSRTLGSIAAAKSPEDLFKRLVTDGQLLQLDENVWPTMYRCCTVTKLELESLKQVGEIVRKGRVVRVNANEVILEKGTYKPEPDTLYIDCSANGILKTKSIPIFNGKHITLQPVRFCQQAFSAALIAHVEATYDDETKKNELCNPVPHPSSTTDYIRINLSSFRNHLRWAAEPKTSAWLGSVRLDWFSRLGTQAPEDPEQAKQYYGAMVAGIQAVVANLEKLLAQLPEDDEARIGLQPAKL